jgi:hypothetical protein
MITKYKNKKLFRLTREGFPQVEFQPASKEMIPAAKGMQKSLDQVRSEIEEWEIRNGFPVSEKRIIENDREKEEPQLNHDGTNPAYNQFFKPFVSEPILPERKRFGIFKPFVTSKNIKSGNSWRHSSN